MEEKNELINNDNTKELILSDKSAKKVLFYTKFEGDTGGDETLLWIIFDQIIKGLDKDAEIGLFLAYDDKSATRADKVAKKFISKLENLGFDENKLHVKTNKVAVTKTKLKSEQGTALLSKCMPNIDFNNKNLKEFIIGAKKKKAPPLGFINYSRMGASA